MRLNRFNDLPPRPADIAKVRRALGSEPTSVPDLIKRTRLTRTAVLSALEGLLAAGEVTKDPKSLLFARIPEQRST